MSAIVAALAIAAGGTVTTLAGCGQRGPLYMPTVPPLPPKPHFETEPQPEEVKPAPDTASSASEPAGSIPDTSGTPLSLTPDDTLSPSPSSPASAPQAAPQSAPDTKPTE